MYVKLQNLIFPSEADGEKGNLFYLLKDECVVSYASYLNGFSVEKWKKYTEIRSIRLCINYSGNCVIRVINYWINDNNLNERTVATAVFDSNEQTTGWIDIPEDVTKGIIGFAVETVSSNFQLISGYFEAEVPEDKVQEVRLALNICTYKRETYVTNTINLLSREVLCNPDSELKDHICLYIQDNGHTLDIGSLENPGVRIVYNKNCGGAGGFTRGLIEILHHMDSFPATHIIMMDDDVEFFTESLFRTYSLLRCRKSEYAELTVGGTMFSFDEPMVQTESGGVWDKGVIVSNKAGLKVDNIKSCVLNEIEEMPQYNAWWYCCMPISFIRLDNLPLPIFFGGDDIEYGLRNIKQLCLLNGICVWHEAFEDKYATSRMYFAHRNMLIDNALYCADFRFFDFARVLTKRVFKEIVTLRYKSAYIFLRASEDFLKGIDFLKSTDALSLLKEVGDLGYKLVPIEDASSYDKSHWKNPSAKPESLWQKFAYAITLGGTLLQAKNRSHTGVLMLHPMDTSAYDVFREEKILYYDEKNHRGFLASRNRKEAIRLIGKTAGLLMRAMPRYEIIKNEYKTRVGEVTSETFWREYLDMDGGGR